MRTSNCPICDAPSGGGIKSGGNTVIVCPECGGYRISGTALTLLENGTLKPNVKAFRSLIDSMKRHSSSMYPLITRYNLEGL